MKYTILSVLFVTILLFGCVQNNVESPESNDLELENKTDEINTDLPNEVNESEFSDADTDELNVNDEIISFDEVSQICNYQDVEFNTIIKFKGKMVKAITSSEQGSMEVIIDNVNEIIYNKGGLTAYPGMENCDWIKYDLKILNAKLSEIYGEEYEDDSFMNLDYATYEETMKDDSIICNPAVIDDSEFIPSGNVCDGTQMMVDMMVPTGIN